MSRPIEPEHRSVRVTTAGTLPVFRAVDQGGLEPHYDFEIRALVETDEYADAGGTDRLGECLIKRGGKIAVAWFFKSSFRISYGKLVFEDLVTALGLAKTRNYTVRLVRCNANGCAEALLAAVAKAPAFRESAGPEAIGSNDSPSADLRSRFRQMMTAPGGSIRHAASCTVCNRLIHKAA